MIRDLVEEGFGVFIALAVFVFVFAVVCGVFFGVPLLLELLLHQAGASVPAFV